MEALFTLNTASIGASRPGNNSNDVTSLPLQRHQCRIVAVRDGRRELAAVTAGIPTKLDPAQPPEPARAQDQPVQRPGPTIMWATVLCAGVWGVALLALGEGDNYVAGFLIMITTLSYFLLLISIGGICSPRGMTSAPAGTSRGGQQLAAAVRHPSACHRPTRRDSSRQSITVSSTAEAARSRPVRLVTGAG